MDPRNLQPERTDYYALLGVAPKATQEEVYQAYRRAAVANHPDKGGHVDLMVRYTAAWAVLRTDKGRAAYDERLRFEGRYPELCPVCAGAGWRVVGMKGTRKECVACGTSGTTTRA